MKITFYIFFLIPLFSFSQKDNIQAVYDSLDNVYFFNSVEEQTSKKFNFKPGDIPSYSDQEYEARIQALAKKSPFNYRYNKIVQNYITMYSKRNKSTGTILSLSKLYFPLYEKYLSQFGLPLELKYLSIVESALNPTAVSPCGASGLWQFMYGTGKSYKLEINSYIDERFDPEKETIAACAYLKDLYEIYGQWDLAIAAYNCGPGNVNKGIKKAGVKDFWAIYDYLPKETQGYVPAFIAASYICEYHEEHNIAPANANFLFEDLDFIELNFKTSIKKMSYVLKIDYKKLKYLNPKFITGIIPGNSDILVVPKQKALDWIDIEKGRPVENKDVLVSKPIPKNNTVASTETLVAVSPSVTQPKQSKSPFGTYTPNSPSVSTHSISTQLANEDAAYSQKILVSKSYLCSTNGHQTIYDGSIISLRVNEEMRYNNQLIPKNSILSGRVDFKANSIFVNIISAKTPSGTIPVTYFTEIQETPNKNKKIVLDDGYIFMLKG